MPPPELPAKGRVTARSDLSKMIDGKLRNQQSSEMETRCVSEARQVKSLANASSSQILADTLIGY
ncbi:MAG: hypothetical protein P8R31_19580 [Mariniblastus sp.]|nr:hypothetical protein [Mariniblastus sp.]